LATLRESLGDTAAIGPEVTALKLVSSPPITGQRHE
jgi:hypothetical protein